METPAWFRHVPALAVVAANINLHRLMGVSTQSAGLLEGDVHRAVLLGGVYVIVALLVIRRFTFSLERFRAEWLYQVLLIYMLASVFWSAYPLKVLTGFGHSVGIWMVGIAAAYWTGGSVRRLADMLVWPLAVVLGISVVVALAIPAVGVDMISGYPRWMGITYHPNSLGIVSLTVTWAALTCIHFGPTARRRVLLWASIGLAALCLAKSNSMTSSLLTVSMLAVHFWTVLVKRSGSTAMAAVVFVCVGLTGLGVIVFTKPGLLTYEGFLHTIGRSATLTGRVDLWELGLSIHAERPLLGWSFDALASVPSRFAIGYGQLHNGFIDLLVRGGAVALFIVALLTLQAALRLLGLYRRSPVEASWGLGLLAAVVLHNVTEASLARAPHPMWMVFSLLLLAATGAASSRVQVNSSATKGGVGRSRVPRYSNIVVADSPTGRPVA